MSSLYFTISALFCIILIMVLFFSKKNVQSKETKIYKYMIISSFMDVTLVIIELIITHYSLNNVTEILVKLLNKIDFIHYIMWPYLLFLYVLYISKKNNSKYDLTKKSFLIFNIICIFIEFFLPLEIIKNGDIMGISGFGTLFVYAISILYVLITIIVAIKNYTSSNNKKLLPLVVLSALSVIAAIVRIVDPTLIVIPAIIVYCNMVMYFTIENPDLKIVNELYKNKNTMEQTYVDKSNFLFEMTQEVRAPLFNIKKICNDTQDSNDIKDYKKALSLINNNSKQLDYIVNDVLNINTLDANQIKFIDNKFKLDLILNEVLSSAKEAINKNVKFTYDFEKDIPELYGDSIKLKQIISALLLDSARRTNEGFIDFRVDTLTRFDALRLIIQIKDSSKGIPIDIVNKIINTTTSLDKTDIENLERNEFSMELCQKVVKLMGGNLIIKSTKDNGTEVILTIDEIIDSKKEVTNDFEKYIDKSKKVVIVNQNKKQVEFMKKYFNANDINPIVLLNGINLIDQIKSGKKYDYIIVSNTMKSINGYTIYQKLKEIEGFNTPVMIITEKESLKKALLEDGFNEVLVDDTLSEDLANIISKY